MSWDYWLPATRSDLKNLWSYVMDQTEHITRIGEITMARVDELRARLAAATDEIARDLDALRARIAQQDEALAAELEPMVARLEQMGADPQNPVPDAPADGGTGQPADGSGTGTGGAVGGGDVVNPTPGAEDNR
jgi:hypothetical protein